MPVVHTEFEPIVRHGRPWLRHVPSGREIPVVRGGDGPDDPPAPPAPPAPPTPPAAPPAPPAQPPAPDLAALQAEIDRARTAGTTEATNQLLQALGFENAEVAQAFVTAARAAEQAQLTEAERREQAADQREAAAQQREHAAAELIDRGTIREALRTAGCPAEALDDLQAVVRVEGDVTAETAAAAVEVIKAKPAFAGVFTGVVTPPVPPAPPGGPGATPPPAGGGQPDPLEAGREHGRKLAAARQGATAADLLADFSPKPSPFAQQSA